MSQTFNPEFWREEIRKKGIKAVENERPSLGQNNGPACQMAIDAYYREQQETAEKRREQRESEELKLIAEANRIAESANKKSNWAIGVSVLAIVVSAVVSVWIANLPK